jgi:hypothetical protein
MNSLDQRDAVGLSKFLGQGLGKLGWLSLCIGLMAISEPIFSGDRLFAFAETCVKPSSLQNFLNKFTLGEDATDRYAAAVNEIENKRLEIFRAAKNHSDWNNVVSMAESQKTKVCNISAPPEFLRSLCNQLRSYSEEKICQHGFTSEEFNQITLEQMENPVLRSLIQDKQMRLRNSK